METVAVVMLTVVIILVLIHGPAKVPIGFSRANLWYGNGVGFVIALLWIIAVLLAVLLLILVVQALLFQGTASPYRPLSGSIVGAYLG